MHRPQVFLETLLILLLLTLAPLPHCLSPTATATAATPVLLSFFHPIVISPHPPLNAPFPAPLLVFSSVLIFRKCL
jgi:hypothetical protein